MDYELPRFRSFPDAVQLGRSAVPDLESVFNNALRMRLAMDQAKQQKQAFEQQAQEFQAKRVATIGQLGFDPYAPEALGQMEQAQRPETMVDSPATLKVREYLARQKQQQTQELQAKDPMLSGPEQGFVGAQTGMPAESLQGVRADVAKSFMPQTYFSPTNPQQTVQVPRGARPLPTAPGKTPPTGYEFIDGGNLRPIVGGPADYKMQEAEDKKRAAMESVIGQSNEAIDAADNALKLVGLNTSGVGSFMSKLPGTEARALSGYIDTLKAKLSFGQLQQMRNESKTGGALGQVSDNELRLLSSAVASLDMGQSPRVLKDNIGKIKSKYEGIVKKMQAGPAAGKLSAEDVVRQGKAAGKSRDQIKADLKAAGY